MKKSELKQLIKEEIFKTLNEGKQVGTLYHFTDSYGFYQILESNKLKPAGNQRYTSFTRNKNLFLNPSLLSGGYYYCLVIDGDKLSNKYNIEPFNDPHSVKDEFEERIVFPKSGMYVDNIKQYIKEIIIMGDKVFPYKFEKTQENIDKIENRIKKYIDVPIEIIFRKGSSKNYPLSGNKEMKKFQDKIISTTKLSKKSAKQTLKNKFGYYDDSDF
jgi:hypothetical protein